MVSQLSLACFLDSYHLYHSSLDAIRHKRIKNRKACLLGKQGDLSVNLLGMDGLKTFNSVSISGNSLIISK